MPENALAFATVMYGMTFVFWGVVFLHDRLVSKHPIVGTAVLAVASLIFYLAAA